MNEIEQLRANIQDASFKDLVLVKRMVDWELFTRSWWILAIVLVASFIAMFYINRR